MKAFGLLRLKGWLGFSVLVAPCLSSRYPTHVALSPGKQGKTAPVGSRHPKQPELASFS